MKAKKEQFDTRWRTAGIAAAFVLVWAFYTYVLKDQDIRFSQSVFSALVGGRVSAAGLISWDDFKAVGLDVGNTYRGLADNRQKSDYRGSFIQNVALGFRKTGARFADFSNWRAYEKTDTLAVVAADYSAKNKTILFVISKESQGRKLKEIKWQE